MGASDLIAYRASIAGFLSTCTIKSSWFADVYNTQLEAQGYEVDFSEPATWKYYLNLQGIYHPADEVITVLSRDTQQEITFDYSTLQAHPRTRAAYSPNMPDHDRLIKAYPEHTDFIKNVLFPVTDIEAAIAAPDVTLLMWGIGYLEDTESQSIIQGIERFLDYIANRWYMEWLSYEPYYYPAFWASLWQHLYGYVSAIRVRNIHTADVHTFHIWEYLTSLGIGDYRDVLSRRQAMFLYRNMRYILRNRGRHSNLILLVNQLLEEQSVAMVNKVIWQQTLDNAAECRWTPELVSEPVQTNYTAAIALAPPQPIQDVMLQLNAIGMEHDVSLEHVDAVTRQLGATSSNRLRSKLLEIQPVMLDRKYAELLNNFILDNLVYMVEHDRYTQTIVHKDAQTGIRLQLSPKNALLFMYYTIWKAYGDTPTNLPTVYEPLVGVFKDTEELVALSTFTTYKGITYPISSFTDVDAFLVNAAPETSSYISQNEFATSIGTMFSALVAMAETIRNEGSAIGVHALQSLLTSSLRRITYALTLSGYTTYAEWLADPDMVEVADLIAAYDALDADTAKSLYSDMGDILLSQLVPPETPELSRYMYGLETSSFYSRIKELFVQLCSYNVLFLDTERGRQHWEMLPRILLDTGQNVSAYSTYQDLSLAANELFVMRNDIIHTFSDTVGHMQATVYTDHEVAEAMAITLAPSATLIKVTSRTDPTFGVNYQSSVIRDVMSTELTFNSIMKE